MNRRHGVGFRLLQISCRCRGCVGSCPIRRLFDGRASRRFGKGRLECAVLCFASSLRKQACSGMQISRLNRTEFIEGGGLVGLAGFKDCGWEMRLVGCVGEVLGLEAKTMARVVGLAGFSDAAVEEVSAVELHARRIG